MEDSTYLSKRKRILHVVTKRENERGEGETQEKAGENERLHVVLFIYAGKQYRIRLGMKGFSVIFPPSITL
jgi:hypothetical protein